MVDVKKITDFAKSFFITRTEAKQNGHGIRAHSAGQFNTIFSIPFDGEKTLGEMGPIKDFHLQYDELRIRSWQSYLESEVTQATMNKFTKWIVGSGLKLQSEPVKAVLESEGISTEVKKFNRSVEALFGMYSKSKKADFSNMVSLNKIANTAILNAKIGGDVLVILRLVKGIVKVQLIDGEHIRNNRFQSNFLEKRSNGNTIINGIETAPNGEHKAFWIMDRHFNAKRIKAKNSVGIIQAFMVYGLRYRLDNNRGIPLISAVMQALKGMERYKDATIGSAEERQKIPYTIEHGTASTGENPLAKNLVKAMDINSQNMDLPEDSSGNALADKIAATTNKQVYNLPIDARLAALESKNELYFKDFYDMHIDLICAALGIPPEVALSKYDSNFSASRAALKDWEHTLLVERNEFKESFYQPIYNFWLWANIHQNKISAPGYITAPRDSDIVAAYENCRFIGANVPHIDPLKEANAERIKLGKTGESLPLTTHEKATEALNGGDSENNLEQYSEELKRSKELDIEVEIPQMSQPNQTTDERTKS